MVTIRLICSFFPRRACGLQSLEEGGGLKVSFPCYG